MSLRDEPPAGGAMSGEVSDGDRMRWQWQAACALTRLLADTPVLPPLIWTVGPTGALVGHLAGLTPPGQVHERFRAWVAALELTVKPPVASSGGAVWRLAAETTRGQVRLRLTASVLAPLPEDDEPPGAALGGPVNGAAAGHGEGAA